MKHNKLVTVIEGGIMVALSYALNLVTIFTMPQGGTITAGAMIPLVIFALRRGVGWGIFAGAVSGTIQFILGPKYSLHPISILCDYSLAYAVIGLSAIYGKKMWQMILGVFTGVFIRFVLHVISGVVVFYEYAKEVNPFVYSVTYNASYLIPELVLTLILSILIFKSTSRILIEQ